MATSGSVIGTYGGYTLSTGWVQTKNIAGNYSIVTCTHTLILASGWGLDIGARTNSCIVGGISQSFTSQAISSGGGFTFTLGTTTHRVNHNIDGTASINLSTTFNMKAYISGVYVPSIVASGTITLDTIPRASKVTCNSFYIGDSTTINIDRASSGFTHTITYSFGNLSGTIATKTSNTSIGWTAPSTFYGQIPNSTTGYGSVTCQTYNGNTLIGTTTANFNAYAKESDCVPTISGTITDTNTSVTSVTGNSNIIVKYLSKPRVQVSAVARNSAGISLTQIVIGDGQIQNSADYTFTNGITSSAVSVAARDSRGFYNSASYNLASLSRWVEYVKLGLTQGTIVRTESTASTVTLTAQGNYYNGNIGATANTLTAKYRYKQTGGSYGSWVSFTPTKSGNTFSSSFTISNIDYQYQYEFEIQVEDRLMIYNSGTIIVSKGIGVWRIGNGYVRSLGDYKDKFNTTITNGLAIYRPSGTDVDPNTTIEELVITETNVPSGGFYYVRTMFYGNKTATANRTQVAYPYAYNNATIRNNVYMRIYVIGTGWTAWKLVSGTTNAIDNISGDALLADNLSIQYGKVVITPTANVPTSQLIYFGRTYAKPPLVVVTASTGVIGTGVLGTAVVDITTTSATISVTRINTVPTGVHFLVIGKEA